MSKAERMIEKIENASDVEIMSFDFDDIFTYVREMEYAISNLMEHKNGDLPMLGNLRDNDKSRKALDQLQSIITES